MNRLTRSILLGFMLGSILVPQFADAAWRTKEIGWHITYTNGLTQGIVQRDTAYTILGGNTTTVDTTAVFSLDDADVLPRGLTSSPDMIPTGAGATGSAAQNDTTIVGYLVVESDSTATAAITNGTFTFITEGRIGGMGVATANSSGWCRVDSTAYTLGAVVDQSAAIPIKTLGKYGSPMSFPQLRMRLLTGGSAFMSSARAFIRYWKNNSSADLAPR